MLRTGRQFIEQDLLGLAGAKGEYLRLSNQISDGGSLGNIPVHGDITQNAECYAVASRTPENDVEIVRWHARVENGRRTTLKFFCAHWNGIELAASPKVMFLFLGQTGRSQNEKTSHNCRRS